VGFEPSVGDSLHLEAISQHIEEHLGEIAFVWHELVSDLVHVDVSYVAPSEGRAWHTFVTSGMSDRPMAVPPGAEPLRHAELMMCLPPEWKVSEADWKDQANYWPIWWLKRLARFPHEYATWLGWGHTVPNGDPPEPFAAGTALCCMLLLTPVLAPEAFGQLDLDGKVIHFYSLVPLYREEMELKLAEGTDALLKRFDEQGVSELLDPTRPNVAI
jgi:hypothetical protein